MNVYAAKDNQPFRSNRKNNGITEHTVRYALFLWNNCVVHLSHTKTAPLAGEPKINSMKRQWIYRRRSDT